MRDPIFEHEVQDPMQTMLNVVRVNGPDGANSVVRMIHHLASLASRWVRQGENGEAFRRIGWAFQRRRMGGATQPVRPRRNDP